MNGATVAANMPIGIAPHCFDSHFDEETHDWRVIIEDLMDTHETRTVMKESILHEERS